MLILLNVCIAMFYPKGIQAQIVFVNILPLLE